MVASFDWWPRRVWRLAVGPSAGGEFRSVIKLRLLAVNRVEVGCWSTRVPSSCGKLRDGAASSQFGRCNFLVFSLQLLRSSVSRKDRPNERQDITSESESPSTLSQHVRLSFNLTIKDLCEAILLHNIHANDAF